MISYKREEYLKRIRGFYYDTDIIKVITSVRRCGVPLKYIHNVFGDCYVCTKYPNCNYKEER